MFSGYVTLADPHRSGWISSELENWESTAGPGRSTMNDPTLGLIYPLVN